MGRNLFAAQVHDASLSNTQYVKNLYEGFLRCGPDAAGLALSNTQYVTNLYEGFLRCGPDAAGLGWWAGQATVGQGRQNVLNAFATSSAFRELAATLYREAYWLVADHLGTPRMVVNKSGTLAGVKRHDYLPFGEELFAEVGGRTTAQGYTASDGVRQKFTRKERDFETGLDYFLARYYSAVQGRFTSPDEFKGGPAELWTLGSGDPEKQALVYADVTNPQSLNKYQYTFNNPLRYVDPDGRKPQDSFHNRMDHLIRQQLKGEITEQEYWNSLRGPAVGTAAAVAIIIAARGGQAVLTPLAIWATRNPDKVQQIAQGLQEAAGGPPGLTLAANSRLRPTEISTGSRLANQLGLRLQESAHEGAEFIVVGTKTAIDALGQPAGLHSQKLGRWLHILRVDSEAR